MQIPFHKTHTTEDEINAAVNAIKSGWLTMGPTTVEFEKKFKDFVVSTYAVSTNSATAALHLALKAIGIEEGDEVIVPTNTFVATAEVVTYFNAIPVLCDIEYATNNIDVSKIEALITSKTKAIIPVHFGGQPCDMNELYEISNKYNLKIVEDAAHAIPSMYEGKYVGNLEGTDITCFSFYATKTLSTGEGGMATTENEIYAKNMRINRLHGISKDAWDRYSSRGSWYYEVIDNGNKYNTTDINSAIGIVQLSKQLELMRKRTMIADQYTTAFSKHIAIETPYLKKGRQSSWHLYVIKVNERDEVLERLKDRGIGCSVHFIPIHHHPYYKNKYKYNKENYRVANEVFSKSLSLPIFPDMSEIEIEYVITNVIDVVNSLKLGMNNVQK